MSLEELHKGGNSLRDILRLRTQPLAVKLYKKAEEFPTKLHRPRDFGVRWAICQAMTMARKIGWTAGVTREESICPPSNMLFGWAELEDEMDFVNACIDMGIGGNVDAAKKTIEQHWRLKKGEYAGIVFSPLTWTTIEPDVVLIYCDLALCRGQGA
jgi:uncharacterized protein (DUF169 family)